MCLMGCRQFFWKSSFAKITHLNDHYYKTIAIHFVDAPTYLYQLTVQCESKKNRLVKNFTNDFNNNENNNALQKTIPTA